MRKDTRIFLAAVLGIPLFLGIATGVYGAQSAPEPVASAVPDTSGISIITVPSSPVVAVATATPSVKKPVAPKPKPAPVPVPVVAATPAPVTVPTTTPVETPAPVETVASAPVKTETTQTKTHTKSRHTRAS